MGHQEVEKKFGPASIIPAVFDIGSTAFLQVMVKMYCFNTMFLHQI